MALVFHGSFSSQLMGFLKLFNCVLGVNTRDGLFCRDAITLKCETLGYVTCQSHKDESNTYKL